MKQAIIVVLVVLLLSGLTYFMKLRNITSTCLTESQTLMNQLKQMNPNAKWEELENQLRDSYVNCLKSKGFPNAERQRFRLQ